MVEEYSGGKRTCRNVPQPMYAELGFYPDMNLQEAKLRAKEINALNAELRKTNGDTVPCSDFISNELEARFLEYVYDNISGKEQARKKAEQRWLIVKRMIAELKLQPQEFFDGKRRIYRCFAEMKYSPDYVKRLIHILNLWGRWISKKRCIYYEKVPYPKGVDREMVNEAYLDSESYFGPSDPLTPEILRSTREKFKPVQWNFLFCSLWLGLRAVEVDMILEGPNDKRWYTEHRDGIDILWVYQTKLTSIPRDKRMKPIPLYYPEQIEAYALLARGEAERPLTKTIQKHMGDYGYFTVYCGRKGTTDLLLGKGLPLEHISQILGHSDISLTWATYKSRTKFELFKPET